MRFVNPKFWERKRILLTGHTGFKGSWLSLWLQSMGAQVYGLAQMPPTSPALYDEANVESDMQKSIIGDIRNYSNVFAAVQECMPEIIIHMAAQSLVRNSYDNPIETYAINVLGTAHIFEAARQVNSVKAIVNVTSDKCYENKEWFWGYREDERIGGYDPYSNSKGCSELVTSAYRKSFFEQSGIALASARAGNVIGGGDWAIDRLVPDILKAFERSLPVVIRNPYSVRPWQHVLEPLAGYLILAERLYNDGQIVAEGWNFGPNDEDVRSVQWIVEYMNDAWGGSLGWTVDGRENLHEASSLKLDISKAKIKLGWHPRWNLQTALTKIIDWHHHWLKKSDVKAKCLQQIRDYQNTTI